MVTNMRPSPTESATVFEIGTKRRGNDGNMYVVATDKNGKYRWAKSKDVNDTKKPFSSDSDEEMPKMTKSKKQTKKAPKTPDVSDDSGGEIAKTKKSAKKAIKTSTPNVSDDSGDDIPKEKKQHTRKAPADPAKNYEIGDKSKGLNGNMYIVKETKNGIKRWFLLH